MSDDQLDAIDIHDPITRHEVVILQADFPSQTLESCYFWYLYHHGDSDAVRSRFAVDPLEIASGFKSDTTARIPTSVNLGVFPAEIWQIISSHLTFQHLSALRLTNSALADIAAESMLKIVRFDLSFESLERLRFIAAHQHLRKGVKSLTFEAGLLAPIGCIHHYSSHYDLEHHEDSKPVPPAEDQSTPQAQRLYARNLSKFNKDLDAKYAQYRKIFEAQERLLHGPKDFLFQCIDWFPNIQAVTLATDQCRHILSERFVERYGQDCAVPLWIDPSQTPWELQSILRPGIKSLRASQISPKVFDGEAGRSRAWLESIFKNLDRLFLQIRHDGPSDDYDVTSILRNANLPYAIGKAVNLIELIINFSTVLSVGHLKDIVPKGKSFQELRVLNIESFIATENELMQMLKLQPSLKSLDLADVMLSHGSWRSVLRRMRDDLNLKFFMPGGVLSDAGIELHTDHFSIDAWQEGEMFSLSMHVDIYVTESEKRISDDEDAFEYCWNPVSKVEEGDFMSEMELLEEFGPIDDSDPDEELDDSDDSDEDNDENFGSDDESMHTANEAMSEHGEEMKEEDRHDDRDDRNQSQNNNSTLDDTLDSAPSSDEDLAVPEDPSPSPMDVD